jgi:hypothetical protein
MRGMTATPSAIDGVVRWMDDKGPGGRSFRESLEAGGIIAEDLLVAAGAVNGLLNSGLTREAFIVLLQALIPNQRNGRPMPAQTINDILDALCHLHTFLETPGQKAPLVVELEQKKAKKAAKKDRTREVHPPGLGG